MPNRSVGASIKMSAAETLPIIRRRSPLSHIILEL
jgi:hypothetical protein